MVSDKFLLRARLFHDFFIIIFCDAQTITLTPKETTWDDKQIISVAGEREECGRKKLWRVKLSSTTESSRLCSPKKQSNFFHKCWAAAVDGRKNIIYGQGERNWKETKKITWSTIVFFVNSNGWGSVLKNEEWTAKKTLKNCWSFFISLSPLSTYYATR